MPETLIGFIERVTYHNPENGFAVLRVKVKGRDDLVSVVGSTTSVTAGGHVEASGCWAIDRQHGQQFKADELKTTHPASAEGIERYLASGAIRSIGPKIAERIVEAYKERSLEIFEKHPEMLLHIKGTIERWGNGGSGINMVGCHRGRVTGCTFRYRGDIFGSGAQTKGGSADITIQRCRFENAGGRAVNIGGSTGLAYFRPKSAAYEAKKITVEDCTFIGSTAAIAFVGVDGAIVRYNTIYRPTRWVARILQESRDARFVACRKGQFTNNLIVFRSDELRTAVNVGGGTAPQTFTFAKNHWYCIDNQTRSSRLSLPVKEIGSSYGTNPRFVDEKQNDLRLSKASPVRDAGVRARKNINKR